MRPIAPLLAAALLLLGGADVASAQRPGFGPQPRIARGAGFGGAYRSPFPPAAWGPGFAPPGWAPPPPAYGPPGWGPPGWGPPPGPVLPPPAAPPYVPTGQAEIARPDPFGPPVRIEPRAKETTVGGVTARRYDYSFDVSPLPTSGALPGTPPGPGWNDGGAAGPGAAW